MGRKDAGGLDPTSEPDHETYARMGEALLVAMEAQVAEVKNTIAAVHEEITQLQREWESDVDLGIGRLISVSFLRRMSQLGAELQLAYKICDSWKAGDHGVI